MLPYFALLAFALAAGPADAKPWCLRNARPVTVPQILNASQVSGADCILQNAASGSAFTYKNGTCTSYERLVFFYEPMAFDMSTTASCLAEASEGDVEAFGLEVAALAGFPDGDLACVPHYNTNGNNLMPVPPEPALSTDTMAECMDICLRAPECTHAVFQEAYLDFGVSACWLKKDFEDGLDGETVPEYMSTMTCFKTGAGATSGGGARDLLRLGRDETAVAFRGFNETAYDVAVSGAPFARGLILPVVTILCLFTIFIVG